jgi:hypothetical protein
LKDLLTHTEALINQVYWFKQDLKIKPSKEHIGCAINWTDIEDRKEDFLRELINTITSWVYNKDKVKQILDERLKAAGGDLGNASTFLSSQAFSKFRPGYPQGQFGELLLFNFIQYFFEAVPLLRKQRITTSTGHERFGADAVHYKYQDDKHFFYLGESKCYESKYQFKNAFETSLSSIVTTIGSFNKELNLYVYDDFLEPSLEKVAKDYKANQLKDVHFELVCLIIYNETNKITGTNEAAIKDSIKKIIEERCGGLDAKCFDTVDNKIIERINYVVFPIWKLDELLDSFQVKVGA